MNQQVFLPLRNEISLFIKREDLLHPYISGNKFRKLKYNLENAKALKKQTLVTFGGAYSNHILAVAAAGKEYGFDTIGIIRGEELIGKFKENPTLSKANDFGMKFKFVSREVYREKEKLNLFDLLNHDLKDYYVLPEGGTNVEAIKGCEEILLESDQQYDFICTAVGTGGTISGIVNSSSLNQKIIGFSALKDDSLSNVICKFAKNPNWELNSNYHFGGYGKVTDELIAFLNSFYTQTKIPLDPIYTGKMVYGVLDLIEKNYFPKGSKILLIHTGGLQGIHGINKILKKKNKQFIEYEIE